MKILAICGSAKRGNSYSVLNKIKEDYPNIDYKLLMLNEVNLKQCRGCYMCVLRGAENCPQKDDRDMIIKEMLDADGIIFESPVYVNHATAIMKNFMERLGYEGHRPRFYDKYAMVIAVCGMFGAKETNEFMNDIFTSFGFNIVSSLELQMATKTEKEKIHNHEKTIEAFNTFINRIEKRQKYTPPLGQIIRFYIFKSISELNKEHFKADYQYYKDKTDFPYDRNINFFKKIMAKRIARNAIKEFMMNR